MKALIFESKVVGLAETDHPVHSSLKWVDAPSNCKRGWKLIDGVLTAPPDPPELTYADKRQAEYPSIQECVHAILDDDLDALQAKRADIKTKYPKE